MRTGRVKVTAFTLSSVAAGAGGAVLCFATQSVSPGAYTLAFSLLLVVAVVLGGLGSIGGAAIGSALIVLLPWALGAATAALPLPVEVAQRLSGNLSILVFGLLLIVVMLVWPGGLASLRRGSRAHPRNRERVHSRTPDVPKHTLSRFREAEVPAGDAAGPADDAAGPADDAAGPADGAAPGHPEPVLSSAPPTPQRKR